MRALVALSMRSRSYAMTASAVCAALSLLFPPLSFASGAVIGLATLKHGTREGLYVLIGSVLLSGAFFMVIAGTLAPGLGFIAATWLLAVVLRTTRSQGSAVVVAAAVAAIGVLAMHWSIDDPVAWWRQSFALVVEQAMRGADPQATAQLAAVLESWAPIMTRMVSAVSMACLVMTLMLARYWQAMLDNPGGFGAEFRQLRLGMTPMVVAVVVALVEWTLGADSGMGQLAADLMGPLGVMLALQGLAVVHTLARVRKVSVAWLVVMYALLVLLPQSVVPILALTGLIDGLMDLRARLAGQES